MFYCTECQVNNDWPEGWLKSYGPCEICDKPAYCNDVPSKYLPDDKEEINGEGEKAP